MINYYFGLPGTGKTTHLTATVHKWNDMINKGTSKVDRVLVNTRVSLPEGVESNVYLIENSDIGIYDMSNSLILLDEAWQLFDCRDYSKMTKEKKDFLNYHRHRKQILYMYNQLHDGLDKKVRNITNNVYYLQRNIFTGTTRARKIQYSMFIPRKPKPSEVVQKQNESSDITMMYYKSGFFQDLIHRLFIERPIKMSKYWPYFDSYEADPLPIKSFEKL